MVCEKCGRKTFGPLCAVCKGERPPDAVERLEYTARHGDWAAKAALDEVARLTALNEDKHQHLQAYCKAADEDKATIVRLTRERDALINLLVQPFRGKWETQIEGRLLGRFDSRDDAVIACRKAAGLDGHSET